MPPVAAVMAAHSFSSSAKPSQPDEVPLQPIMSTSASASRRAAATMVSVWNWRRASSSRLILTTGKREKCTVTPGSEATMACERGSSEVLDEGVRMPRRMGRDMMGGKRGSLDGDRYSSLRPPPMAIREKIESAREVLSDPQRLRDAIHVNNDRPEGINGKHSRWSNPDLDPTPPVQRSWSSLSFFAFQFSIAFSPTTYNAGAMSTTRE
ncbi:hypothetical protein VTK73DRAFT_5422 [Phialemonium thermophilum]|uniref:Uncharacterized protein n=1 Tax=Phialemonium thermophilum TaxID=223376 RepID=A0ABR3V1U3_9PEZI